VAALALLVAFVLADPGKPTIFGLDPLIANTPAREADRIVGPFCALWFAIFVLPFFLFTPDAPPSATGARIGVKEAFRALGETLRNVRAYRDITLFLIAHLLFIDGLLAIFSFGGIYATTIFGWQGPQLAIFGIMLAIAGGLGAFGGGFLDDRLGSKTVIIGALILLIVACLGAISIDRTHVLFAFDVGAPEDNRAYFDSVGEAFYLFFGLLIGISAGPLQAASRSFLARLAPPEQMTEFFGLFAFSGKVSAFAAPLTIGLVNQLTGSLRLGMASILIYLAVGLAVMFAIGRQKPSRSA
jgi:UMF1 family MFS transporter